MTRITVPLSEERLQQLREVAAQAGVTPEEFARAILEERLGQRRDDFLKAVQYVLEKNGELYRQLSQYRGAL